MTYYERIEKIKSVKEYLINLLNDIMSTSGIVKVSGKRGDILNSTEYPLVVVSFTEGLQYEIRTAENATLKYEITVKNQCEDELDILNYCKYIVELFESPTLDSQAVGCKAGLPAIYYQSPASPQVILAVIDVEVEIK